MPISRIQRELIKVLIVSRKDTSVISRILYDNNFEIVNQNPDFMICSGGDGTVLYSERKFPGVPKLLLKNSKTCRKCDYRFLQLEEILIKIKEGKYTLRSEMKLETKIKDTKLVGLNEIQIHTRIPISAIRFWLSIGKKRFLNLIGDGVIVATPFGSTGYYKSTGGKGFERGIGISFNNLHNRRIESFIVNDNEVISVGINRGPASVYADNYRKSVQLSQGDIVHIRKCKEQAIFIDVSPGHAGNHKAGCK
jgi:NAD+ kinase